MKNVKKLPGLIIIIWSIIFFSLIAGYSCNNEKKAVNPIAGIPQNVKIDTVRDTVYIPTFDYAMKDSMIDEMNHLKDSLFNERYKIESVKYYLKIVKRRPSQVKFLVSWIDRAVK